MENDSLCSLCLGVDYTISNVSAGKRTFGGKSLHFCGDPNIMNPYMQAIYILGKTLEVCINSAVPFKSDVCIGI